MIWSNGWSLCSISCCKPVLDDGSTGSSNKPLRLIISGSAVIWTSGVLGSAESVVSKCSSVVPEVEAIETSEGLIVDLLTVFGVHGAGLSSSNPWKPFWGGLDDSTVFSGPKWKLSRSNNSAGFAGIRVCFDSLNLTFSVSSTILVLELKTF